MTDTHGDHLDQAIAAIGGEEAEFMVSAVQASDRPGTHYAAFQLQCRSPGCDWGYHVGEMDLWELVVDARDHWEEAHVSHA